MAALIESVHRYAGITIDARAKTIRVAPWIPAEWPHLRVRRRVGDLRFEVCYERKEGTGHRLQLHPLTGVGDGYSVAVGVRLEGRQIRSTSLNGEDVEAANWTHDDCAPGGTSQRAWLCMPLSGDIDLQVTTV